MSDYILREETIKKLDDLCDIVCQYSKKQRSVMCGACPLGSAFDAIEELPTADVVERSTFEQVRWERDSALAQLAEIGKGLGEKMDDVVERKKGKWIPLGHRIGYLKHPLSEDYKCSNCGYEQYTIFFDPPEKCPNCGAKMEMET